LTPVSQKRYDLNMTKAKVLTLSGLVVFAIAAGGLYNMTIPLMNLKTFKDMPAAQQSFNKLFWLIILGGAAMITAGFLRLTYEILYGRRRKK
jgi:hypothetical protein